MLKTLLRIPQSQSTTTFVWLKTTSQAVLARLTKPDSSKALAESAMISCTKDSSKIIFITDGEDTLIIKEYTGDYSKMDSETEEESGRPTTERAKMEIGFKERSNEEEKI